MSAAKTSLFEEILSPSDQNSRQDKILAAAGLMFIQHGFEGVSMDVIAKAAGVARQTLYNRFPDGKESLFGAVAERMWQAFPVMSIASDEDALSDPEVGLRRIGLGVAQFWSPPLAVDFLRLVIAEGRRFPQLTKRFFEVGKTPAVSAVRDYIAELGRRGKLQIHDADLASQQFLGMIDETVLWVRVMGDNSALPQEKIDQVVDQAVEIFLTHYQVA
ncbi:TetR/AcrR family transcriptional regulator [Pseudomonas sp. RC3H12]|uniref:TetR/AcrR family transcriptional regulator n=1 Tax=Pseudomonas sp. RC3H12 TaxID=2834406 RepID=UPI001BDECE26|nr:TetR/AcrR family transcriptional regulator [Pseudomonas sp. RC3H12]QWA30523.1 TetR/AcrR family transcriptional regulator [Pseudomonas sp. RC3H12]